jgi:hypothetical protein
VSAELIANPAKVHLPEWRIDPTDNDKLSNRLGDLIYTSILTALRKP